MKAVILALAGGVICMILVTWSLRRRSAKSPAAAMVKVYLLTMPILLLADLLSPPDLWGAAPAFTFGWAAFDAAYCLFLFTAGFFGGVLQLYNLADRGFSLRMLIDIAENPRKSMSPGEMMASYSAGKGIEWMYEKRLGGMVDTGLIGREGSVVFLTQRGKRAATFFGALRNLLRFPPPGAAELK
jgi:hypothetical protein